MIFQLPYSRNEFNLYANEQLGIDDSFLKKLISGKQKSPQMEIIDWHGPIWECLNNSRPRKGRIELRTDGIIITIKTSKKKFGWIIPFYKLHVFKSAGLHVYAEGNKISFRINSNSQRSIHFLTKLMIAKLDHKSSQTLFVNYDA